MALRIASPPNPAVNESAAEIGADPSSRSTGGLLTIDLDALAANWRTLRDQARGAECAAVIKADGYGIGLEPALRALARAGCRTFFVAHLSEGARARAVNRDATIYVLNGLLPRAAPAYAGHALRPVLGSQDEIAEWADFCHAQRRRLPAAVHVDTGMNRLGLPVAEALRLAGDSLMRCFEPALLMSHLVSAEASHDPLNARQIAAFERVRAAFGGVLASLANSSGIFLPQRPYYDLVRPGYALYGGNPTPGAANPMRSVVRLDAPIVQVRAVEAGETAGYNGTWTAPERRRLATLSVGYADGYLRAGGLTDAKASAGSSAGVVIVAGRRCPVVGRISMDLLSVDVSGVPDGAVRRGDRAVLIGDGLTVDEVGERAGTIGYEILTSLGRRYARVYLEAGC
jgi:alanine racemase